MIKNRVKESGVITLDLISFCNTNPRKTIDLVGWLERGLIKKERAFKNRLNSMNIDSFSGA